jgi:hypothetical protein
MLSQKRSPFRHGLTREVVVVEGRLGNCSPSTAPAGLSFPPSLLTPPPNWKEIYSTTITAPIAAA